MRRQLVKDYTFYHAKYVKGCVGSILRTCASHSTLRGCHQTYLSSYGASFIKGSRYVFISSTVTFGDSPRYKSSVGMCKNNKRAIYSRGGRTRA